MRNNQNQIVEREDSRPDCPNCGRGILRQAEEVENTAVRAIH